MLTGLWSVAILAMTAVPGGSTSAADGDPTPVVTDLGGDPGTTINPGTLIDPAAPIDPDSAQDPAVTTTPTPVPPTPVCTPATALVDPDATPEAVCLAARLDEWQASGRYGIGQQINASSSSYLEPVTTLAPDRPAVVGFDLSELDLGETYGFDLPPLESLLRLSAEGVVLTASWHTANPKSGLDSGDRRWQSIHELLDPTSTRAARSFWADYDAKLDLFRRLQSGEDGAFAPAAVIFRPLHEANGTWFWWAQGTDPADYRALYAALQQRAWDAGVHNIVWAWSPNAVTNDYISDPAQLRPERVDIGGIDSYESMHNRGEQDQQLNITGLAEIAGTVPRVAVTEAGPHGSVNGAWDPTVIARTAVQQNLRPVYVMLWFDDGDGADGYTGKKQIGSLRGGRSWLSQCPQGVCSL
ncbi:MAG: hypothetical protein CMJ44_04440 [Pimelobacter sp.]|nr:hypothetical protein [Pimelobacter sp.]